MFAVALALVAFFLSIWIVIPGPILPLFVLSVGGTELWPALLVLDAAAVAWSLRVPAPWRIPSLCFSTVAAACTFVPPAALLLHAPATATALFVSPFGSYTKAPRNAPVVLTIYGGAWERGSPKNEHATDAAITSWGYRVIPLDYPHAPQHRWPAQLNAVLREIDAIHAPHIALIGHSSGAQLAIIAASLRPHRIDAVVTYASPVDLRLGYEYPSQPDVIQLRHILTDLCGGTPKQHPRCYRSASPRYAIHAGMPPVLIIAGGNDHVVDVRFERLLRNTLQKDRVPVEYLELPWADHSFESVPFGFHDRIALWYVRQFLHARMP